jgi:hypothetical protein
MKLIVLALLLLLVLTLTATSPQTFADISGDGANHQIASSGICVSIQFIAPNTNSNVVRVGDSSISATQGAPIAPGAGLYLPKMGTTANDRYPLSIWYYRIAVGDKLSILCGN